MAIYLWFDLLVVLYCAPNLCEGFFMYVDEFREFDFVGKMFLCRDNMSQKIIQGWYCFVLLRVVVEHDLKLGQICLRSWGNFHQAFNLLRSFQNSQNIWQHPSTVPTQKLFRTFTITYDVFACGVSTPKLSFRHFCCWLMKLQLSDSTSWWVVLCSSKTNEQHAKIFSIPK